MSNLPPDDGPPQVFPPDDDGGAAPAATRDVRAEALEVINTLPEGAPPVTAEQVQEELKSKGYVPEGKIKAALDSLVNDGLIEVLALGDPSVAHFRRRTIRDVGLLRAVALELAGAPNDTAPEGAPRPTGPMTLHEVTTALAARNGAAYEGADVEPVLLHLAAQGVVTIGDGTRVLPTEPGAAGGETVKVTVYSLAAGVYHRAMVPGLDALLGIDATAPDGTPVSSVAVAATQDTKAIVTAQEARKKAEAAAKKAEKRAADAEAQLARAKAKLTDRGLHGLFEEAVAVPVAVSTTPDERGKPIRFEKRVPVTTELKAAFWVEACVVAGEVESLKARVEGSKDAHKLLEAETKERLSILESQLQDMRAASREGKYLLVVAEGYKLFDPETGRTGVYEYATRKWVCWDDPADLKPGAQAALPGLDATIGKHPPDAGNNGGDAAGTSGGTPPPEPPKTPPGAPGAPTAPSASNDGEALDPGAQAALDKMQKASAANDAAAEASKAAEAEKKAKADAVKAGGGAPTNVSGFKPVVVAMLKAAPTGILWRDADSQVTDSLLHAYAEHIGKDAAAVAPSTKHLLTGAIETLLKSNVLAQVKGPTGTVLYHPDNGDPLGPAAKGDDAGAEGGKAGGKGGKGRKKGPAKPDAEAA